MEEHEQVQSADASSEGPLAKDAGGQPPDLTVCGQQLMTIVQADRSVDTDVELGRDGSEAKVG